MYYVGFSADASSQPEGALTGLRIAYSTIPIIGTLIAIYVMSDYEINEEGKSVLLTNDGMEFAEKLLLENNLIKEGTLQDLDNMALNHNIIQALRAHKLFIRDKDYILKDKQVIFQQTLTSKYVYVESF